ncbi:hypothetical protein FIBSPDRAFT_862070 [Athelia psychrophila]|uniref:Uncharacterized protein n=1 Tax=Athelia psychrophila TaxID=1759441 RepID=A0A166IPX4_9AGAM|nr:hypothetical protein FIBSPDRAFT_862070 [Fibularhizoctonia sp. CBS 109695]
MTLCLTLAHVAVHTWHREQAIHRDSSKLCEAKSAKTGWLLRTGGLCVRTGKQAKSSLVFRMGMAVESSLFCHKCHND